MAGAAVLAACGAEDAVRPLTPAADDRVLFSSSRGGDPHVFDIYSMRFDGSDVVRLTNSGTAASSLSPTWFANRTRVSFISDRDQGTWGVYTMDADGSNVRRVPIPATPYQSIASASASPDGARVAFYSFYNIWVVNSDGSGLLQLTSGGASIVGAPRWSPDGARIAYVSTMGSEGYQVRVVDAAGGTPVRVTNMTDVEFSSPSWSPDGTRLAVVRAHPGTWEGGIATIRADGSDYRALTPTASLDWGPSWSPDGTRLVFSSSGRENTTTYRNDLFMINADGSGLVRLTSHDAHDVDPAWR